MTPDSKSQKRYEETIKEAQNYLVGCLPHIKERYEHILLIKLLEILQTLAQGKDEEIKLWQEACEQRDSHVANAPLGDEIQMCDCKICRNARKIVTLQTQLQEKETEIEHLKKDKEIAFNVGLDQAKEISDLETKLALAKEQFIKISQTEDIESREIAKWALSQIEKKEK